MADIDGDYAWVMTSSALVFMMLPGIALFYSGLRSQTTALSLLWLNMMVFSLVTVQWFLLGYSLVFSPTSNSHYIGNLYNAAFLNTVGTDSFAGIREGDTPALMFGVFQGMFASFTMALITGVVAERGRLLPFLVFAIVWTTLVYDPIAYWMWNLNGWGNRVGALDWAGGTPVHISSGAASLAYTLMLKYARINSPEKSSLVSGDQEQGRASSPSPSRKRHSASPRVIESRLGSHNIPMAYLGLLLVWFGWFGFNAGSELKANMRAASTFMTSNIAAASGGFAYCIYEKWSGVKPTGVGFCTGVFAGLVAITPGAGYVPMWAGLVFGITASAVVFSFLLWQGLLDWLEDPLDISIIHGGGGLWGMLLTGIFADKDTALLDGTEFSGGAISGHPIQILYQLAGGVAGFAYSFTATLIILIIIHGLSKTRFFPGLALRAESQIDDQLGDRNAYQIECYYHSVPERDASPERTPEPQEQQSPVPQSMQTGQNHQSGANTSAFTPIELTDLNPQLDIPARRGEGEPSTSSPQPVMPTLRGGWSPGYR